MFTSTKISVYLIPQDSVKAWIVMGKSPIHIFRPLCPPLAPSLHIPRPWPSSGWPLHTESSAQGHVDPSPVCPSSHGECWLFSAAYSALAMLSVPDWTNTFFAVASTAVSVESVRRVCNLLLDEKGEGVVLSFPR